MKKQNPQQPAVWGMLLLMAGILLAFYGLSTDRTWLMLMGMLIMVGSIPLRMHGFRCPRSGRRLYKDTGAYCQSCGKCARGEK